MKRILATVAAVLVLLTVGGLLLAAAGVYNIAADRPHLTPVAWALRLGRTRSVKVNSRYIQARYVPDRLLIRNGFLLYRRECQPCHGAPGIAAEQIGRGINPHPPPLQTASTAWTDPQLFWIISHGLKLSGMPAFAARVSEPDRWAIVAFLRRMAFFTPADYERFTKAAESSNDADPVSSASDDHGFAQLAQGNPERGRQLLRKYGCHTCHTIPSIGSGSVGPPLTQFAERHYVAGLLVNVPANAVAWITDPHRFKPNTAMPALKVQPGEALDIVAHLYTLGSPARLNTLRETASRRP